MLTLTLQIHDDGADAEAQARAVVATLVAMYGPQIIPASYEQVGSVARATGPVVLNVHTTEPTRAPLPPADQPAPDGFPMDADQPAAPPPPPGTVDTAGTPWDERIHASTKTTNKDGTWTRRRNTPDATFDSVMAELKATAKLPTPPAPPAPQAPPADSAAAAFGAPPPAPPAAPTPPAGDVPTSLQLMTKVTAMQKEGKIDAAKLTEILQGCGIDGIAKVFSASEESRAALAMTLDAM